MHDPMHKASYLVQNELACIVIGLTIKTEHVRIQSMIPISLLYFLRPDDEKRANITELS